MNMEYHKGQIVGYVPVGVDYPSVPIALPRRWYVLKTFANRENKVMRTYAQRGISAYFPTVRSEVVRETRRFGVLCRRIKRTVISPMFAGVIFIPDFQAKIGGVIVEGVEGYFKMGDCFPYLTPTLYGEVREIEANGNIPVARQRRLMAQGQRVYITDGPFAMFAGKFEKLDSEGRLKVLVDLFGRQTPITLDEDQIELA